MNPRRDIQYDSYAIRTMHQELAAFILAIFLETLLFGAFAVTYTMGAWSLTGSVISGRRSRRSWILLGASTAMFALALTHLALSLKLTLNGFVTNAGSLESVAHALFGSSLWIAPLGVSRFGIYVTQTLIGDAFMIYRLFLVWNQSRKAIVLPVILCFIDGVCGYLGVVQQQRTVSLTFMPLVFFTFSFITNVLCSGLIIWRVVRNVNPYTALPARVALYRKVVEAIVQSAAIYSTASIALLVTFFISPNIGFAACMGVFPPLIGLVFSFIVLRLARNSTSEDDAPGRAPPTLPNTTRERSTTARPVSSIVLHTPRSPQAAMHIPAFDFSRDTGTFDGSMSGSAASINLKPAEPLGPSNSSTRETGDVEDQRHRTYPGVLDIRASKAPWDV